MVFDPRMTVSAKIEGDISELLAKLMAAKAAIREFKREGQGRTRYQFADDLQKELVRVTELKRKGIVRKAVSDMFKTDDIAKREGESTARAWSRAFQEQMKKERGFLREHERRWLPFIGLGLGAAPSALTGLAGILGGLGVAGLGAAAGLGAIGISAQKILSPVKQAFQSINQLSTSGTNQTLANARALQQWIGGTTT